MPLPNLIVIGAPKCGTTSLHSYLGAHPEIAMSREKELDFFLDDESGDRSLGWYASQFEEAPVRGEASPRYSVWPIHPGVPERMSSVIPETRLVYLVRDPIERLVSHWVHNSLGFERAPFAEAVTAPGDNRYLAASSYATQLERYLEHFPRERILIVDADDMRRDRAATLRRVFGFAGVDETASAPSFSRELNVAAGTVRRNRAGNAVASALAQTLGTERAERVRNRLPEPLKRPFTRTLEPPCVEGDLRRRLVQVLGPEVERLRQLTGQSFAGWSL